jgi:hypothetical protein
MQPKDPRIVVAEMKTQLEMAKLQNSQQEFAATLMEDRRLNQAEMVKIQAQVIHLLAQAEGEIDNKEIVRMQTALAAMKSRDESIRGRVDQLLKLMEMQSEPDRRPVDAGEVQRLAGASGDGALQSVPPAGTGIPEGAMG